MSNRLKAWEIALLAALCLTVGVGLWARSAHASLADSVVRLHVIGSSDSEADQAEKLVIRDRVLELLSPLLARCRTQEEAVAVIEAHRTELEAVGDVAVELGVEHYPTRDYDTFSLPAGEYVSLRVAVGEGAGRNWWCVVFPPLCTEALADDSEDAFLALGEENAALVTRPDGEYELKFRVLEWWDSLRALFQKETRDTGA